jgi:hypothetical protein
LVNFWSPKRSLKLALLTPKHRARAQIPSFRPFLVLKTTQKSLKKQGCFLTGFWDPKRSPKCSQIEPRSLPRRSWSTPPAAHCFRTRFWCFSDPPGPMKIMLPCRREHVFHKIRLSSRGPEEDPKMTPKSTPKLPPGSTQVTQNSVQNRCLVFEQIPAQFWYIFGTKTKAQMNPKIT